MTTPVYCSIADVADFLSVDINSNTKPNIAQVTKLINSKEDNFDRYTGHAFRIKTITNEYHRLPDGYTAGRGNFIDLRHRIVTITKLEQWDGNNWQDITGSADAYSYISELGQLYVKGYLFTIMRENKFRVSYTFGETIIPSDVKECIVKQVAIEMINANWLLDKLPVGGDNEQMTERVRQWKEDADDIMCRYQEMVLID